MVSPRQRAFRLHPSHRERAARLNWINTLPEVVLESYILNNQSQACHYRRYNPSGQLSVTSNTSIRGGVIPRERQYLTKN